MTGSGGRSGAAFSRRRMAGIARRAAMVLLAASVVLAGGLAPTAGAAEDKPSVVRWGDDPAGVTRQLEQLRPRERVLVFAHGGGRITPAGAVDSARAIQQSPIGAVADRVVMVDFLSHVPLPEAAQFVADPLGGAVNWVFDTGGYYAGMPSTEQVRFFAGVVKGITNRTGRPPEGLCHSAGAVLCRQSLSAGATFASLSLVDMPVPAVNGGPLTDREVAGAPPGRAYNFYASAAPNEGVGRIAHGAPIARMHNVDLGPMAHAGMLTQPAYLDRQTAAIQHRLPPNVVQPPGLDAARPANCPPACPPFLPPTGQAGELGGVDFSPVRLSMLAERPSQTGTALAFAMETEDGSPTSAGTRVDEGMRAAATSFAVWLTTPDQTHTVNLSPAEPTRILNPALQRTYPGRVMAEADLQLKRDAARLTDPRGPGLPYWDGVRTCSGNATEVTSGNRVWVEPAGPAQVWIGPHEIAVGATPLRVLLESARRGSAELTPLQECLQRHENEVVLPQLQRLVDNDKAYARLRQVYAAKVAATAYKSAFRSSGLFAGIVDRGDVGPFRTEASWDQEDLYQEYLRSYRDGEYDVTVGNGHYFRGGVDFSDVQLVRATPAELAGAKPALAEGVVSAMFAAGDPGSARELVGGIVRKSESRFEPAPALAGPTWEPGYGFADARWIVDSTPPGRSTVPIFLTTVFVAPVALGLGSLLAYATRGPPPAWARRYGARTGPRAQPRRGPTPRRRRPTDRRWWSRVRRRAAPRRAALRRPPNLRSR